MLTFVTSGGIQVFKIILQPSSENMRVRPIKAFGGGGGRRLGSINRITVTATHFIVYENGPMDGTPVDGTILPIVPCRPSDPAESFLIRWKRGKPSKKTKKQPTISRRVGFVPAERTERFSFKLDCLYFPLLLYISFPLFFHKAKIKDTLGHVHLSYTSAANQSIRLASSCIYRRRKLILWDTNDLLLYPEAWTFDF